MEGKGREGKEEDEGERPIENIFYGQPTAASSSRRNCDGLGAVVAAAQNEPRSILPLMNGLEDGARSPWPSSLRGNGCMSVLYFIVFIIYYGTTRIARWNVI